MFRQGGHQTPGSMPATGKATTLILDHPAISCKSVRDRRPRASAASVKADPQGVVLDGDKSRTGLLGSKGATLRTFPARYISAARLHQSGSPQRGQEWNSRTGSWLRTDLPRQLPASLRLAPLLTHVRAAGTQNLCEELKIPSELASLSSENAKCHFKRKAGWRWRACPCTPRTPLQTNH